MPIYKNTDKNTWYTSFYYTDWTGMKRRKKKKVLKLKKKLKNMRMNLSIKPMVIAPYYLKT